MSFGVASITGALNNYYPATFLENDNVFVNGAPWSYSQQGACMAVAWDTVGSVMNVTSPDPDFPSGCKLKKRLWDIHKRLVICGFNGQSNGAGANTNMANVSDPTPPYMQLAPIEDIFRTVISGDTPTQDGVASTAVTTFINIDNYQGDLVAARANINTNRIPGDEVNRQTWSLSFGQTISAALPNDNIYVGINVSHGGTTFNQDVQGAAFVQGATWDPIAGGTATIIFTTFIGAAQGDVITLQNAGGWPTTITVATSNGQTITASVTSDPGAFPAQGFALVMMPPMVNLFAIVRYLATVIAPMLGLEPYFLSMNYNGNEADSSLATPANFAPNFAALRSMATNLGVACGQAEPVILGWPQVGYNVDDWHNNDQTLFNCASNVTLGVLQNAQDPANVCITCPQYSSPHAAAGPCIHYHNKGHIYNGERLANLILDYVTGDADTTPLQLLSGEEILVRVANSTTISGVYNKAAVSDASLNIADPGNLGFQVAAGVQAVAGAYGINGLLQAVTSAGVSGTAVTVVTTALPSPPWGNYLCYADAVGPVYTTANNIRIIDQSYSANVGTYTTIAPHGLSPDDTTVIANMPRSGFNVIPGAPALSGTTGSTIKMSLPSNPGAVTVTGATYDFATQTITLTTSPSVSWTLLNYVTVSGVTPSGYNGSAVQIIAQPASNKVTLGGYVSNPGPYTSGGVVTGGGSIAINGQYDVGTSGPCGIVREPVIDHYSGTTGAPLPRWQVRQRVPIDVYASTKAIMAALVECGLDSFFELVLPFGDGGCYGGSGNGVTNLGTALTVNDYWRGLSGVDATRTPTFEGTPNSQDRTNDFISTTSGKIFTPQGAATILANAHKAGQGGTVIGGIWVPSTITTNQYQISTCQAEASGTQGPGTALRVANSNFKWTLLVKGAGTSTAFSRSSSFILPTNTFSMFGAGWQDGDNTSWMYTYDGAATTTAAGIETFTPTYASPSAASAQSPAYLWQNGSTGTVRAQAGLKMMWLLASNSKLSQQRALPLLRTLFRSQIRNLP